MNIKEKKNNVQKNTMQQYYQLLLPYLEMKYVKEAILTFFIIGFLSAGYFIFSWYQNRQNMQAFAGLIEISKSYEKALAHVKKQQESLDIDSVENPWEDVQLLLDAIGSKHANSSLAPFFMFYQAELALIQEEDYVKACTLMKKGLSLLPKTSIYYDMFTIKLIKMLLDSTDQSTVESALKDLKLMAENPENYCYQEALYILAQYQIAQNNMKEAIQALQLLGASQDEKAIISSPFVTHAQEKLKSLRIDSNH